MMLLHCIFLRVLVCILTFHISLCHVFHVNVTDNVPQGTVLADLRSLLENRLQSSVLSSMSFVFLNSPNESLFQLESSSGLVKAAGALDRDSLCPGQAVCPKKLDIGVHPAKFFEKINLFLDFIDENDNAPQFPSSQLQLNISEATRIGAELPLQAAYDRDSPQNGIDSYQMQSSVVDLPFDLRVNRDSDGSFELHLVLTKPLDREKLSVYRVQLIATDRGQPARTGSTNINVVVTDVNDNQPSFNQSTYELEIHETPSATSNFVKVPLMTVHATDADTGDNGRVKYSFSRRTEMHFGDKFSIDRNSGQIYLLRGLDYEQDRSITLEILAQDEGPGSSPVQARVVINVRDINDNAPYLEMTSSNARSHGNLTTWEVTVMEHSPNGTEVGHVSVSDPDTGQGGYVTCSMRQLPDSTRPHFHLVEMAGEYVIVTSAEPIDRELTDRFDLTVSCRDHGENVLSASLQVRINVEDINDHKPVFSQTEYSANIKENTAPLEVLVQVTATDADISTNSDIVYALRGADGFDIDAAKGVIWTNSTFDRELKEHHKFQVIAYNRGAATAVNPGTATANVLVTILDVNDQPPRFTQSNYIMNVSENAAVHTLVGQVTAIDGDLPPNNKHSYHLDVSKVTGPQPRNDPISKFFYVDQQTGHIFTKSLLDREVQMSYQLTVVARDDVVRSLHDSAIVTIYVTDVNDQSPVINFPTPKNDTVYVTCDAPVGSHVTRIEASDSDDGDSGRLQYFISEVNKHRLFRVNSDTGEVFVNGSLMEFDMDTFRLDIEVQDRGIPIRSTKTTLFVSVKPALPVAEAPSTGFLLQLLELPVNGQRLAIVVSVLAGCTVIIIASCVAACFVLRRQRKTRQYGDSKNGGNNIKPTATATVTTTNSSSTSQTSDGTSRLCHAVSSSAVEPPPATPATSSLCSSSCQGQGGRASSMATASLCLEDDEQWDNIPRPPSLSYCVSTTGSRNVNLGESTLLSRRFLPAGTSSSPTVQLHHGIAVSSRPFIDNATNSLGRYDMYSTSTMSPLYDRICCPNDVSRMYSNTVTSSLGFGARMASHPHHSHRMSSGEQRPVITDSSDIPDQWLGSTSRKPSFSTWLNKESFQLQQNGHRYRVNDGSTNGGVCDNDTSLSQSCSYSSSVYNEVGRSRLHSDTDVKEGKNVHFNDTTTTIGTSSSGHGSLRKPVVINCANATERYISLG